MIETLAIILLLVFLGISAYQDWITREITDWVWITLLAIGLVINTIVTLTARDRLQTLSTIALSTIIAASIGFIFFYLYIWGGGDLLMYLAASFVSATLPISLFSPRSFEVIPFGISALANTYLFTAVLPGYFLLENTYRRFVKGEQIFQGFKASVGQKIFIALVGRPIKLADLHAGHISFYTILEEKRADTWCINFHSGMKWDEDTLETKKRAILKEAENDLKPYIWISYTLPSLVFLTVGFLITAIYGTLLFRLWFLLQAL